MALITSDCAPSSLDALHRLHRLSLRALCKLLQQNLHKAPRRCRLCRDFEELVPLALAVGRGPAEEGLTIDDHQ